MGFQSFITKGLILAVIVFIASSIFGIGGGFVALFSFGHSIAKLFSVLPWWLNVFVGLSILWLFFGKK